MATTYVPMPIPIHTSSSSKTQRSARDICENDYGYTEDPALANCMAEIVADRQHDAEIANTALEIICEIAVLTVIAIVAFMIYAWWKNW